MLDVLVITGSMGAGKTATLAEASDLLTERGIMHAAIDLDALGLAFGQDGDLSDIAYRNLAAVCANYESAGIQRLLAAGAIESSSEFERIRQATNARRILVCRLRAPISLMEARVADREKGIFADRYVERVRVLEEQLDRAALEHFSVDTANATITNVARHLLCLAGWLVD